MRERENERERMRYLPLGNHELVASQLLVIELLLDFLLDGKASVWLQLLAVHVDVGAEVSVLVDGSLAEGAPRSHLRQHRF